MEELKSSSIAFDPVLATIVFHCFQRYNMLPILLHSWPGGAEQSQAFERPCSGQVSAPKETWPVSVSHKSGEGISHSIVSTKHIHSFPGHLKTISQTVLHDLSPNNTNSFVPVPGQVYWRAEPWAMSHLCPASGTGGEHYLVVRKIDFICLIVCNCFIVLCNISDSYWLDYLYTLVELYSQPVTEITSEVDPCTEIHVFSILHFIIRFCVMSGMCRNISCAWSQQVEYFAWLRFSFMSL